MDREADETVTAPKVPVHKLSAVPSVVGVREEAINSSEEPEKASQRRAVVLGTMCTHLEQAGLRHRQGRRQYFPCLFKQRGGAFSKTKQLVFRVNWGYF